MKPVKGTGARKVKIFSNALETKGGPDAAFNEERAK
jgi:hypothetical protein